MIKPGHPTTQPNLPNLTKYSYSCSAGAVMDNIRPTPRPQRPNFSSFSLFITCFYCLVCFIATLFEQVKISQCWPLYIL